MSGDSPPGVEYLSLNVTDVCYPLRTARREVETS